MDRDDLARRVMARAHKRLVRDLEPMTLLDEFYEVEFMVEEELRDIQETHTTSMKNRLILTAVGKGGWTKYEVFKECLKKSHQAHLVEYLLQLEQQVREDKRSSQPTDDSQAVPLSNQPTVYAQAVPYIPTTRSPVQLPTDIDRVPNDREIQGIGSAIGFGWKLLGSELGVPRATLEHIEMDHRRALDQIVYMLHTWKRRSGDKATIRCLFEAIKNIDTMVTVDWDIIRKYLGYGPEVLKQSVGVVKDPLFSQKTKWDPQEHPAPVSAFVYPVQSTQTDKTEFPSDWSAQPRTWSSVTAGGVEQGSRENVPVSRDEYEPYTPSLPSQGSQPQRPPTPPLYRKTPAVASQSHKEMPKIDGVSQSSEESLPQPNVPTVHNKLSTEHQDRVSVDPTQWDPGTMNVAHTEEVVTRLSDGLESVQIGSQADGGGKRREDALGTSSEGGNSGHVPSQVTSGESSNMGHIPSQVTSSEGSNSGHVPSQVTSSEGGNSGHVPRPATGTASDSLVDETDAFMVEPGNELVQAEVDPKYGVTIPNETSSTSTDQGLLKDLENLVIKHKTRPENTTVVVQETPAPSEPMVTAISPQESPAKPTPGGCMTDSDRLRKLFASRDGRLVDMQEEDVKAIRKFCEGAPERGAHGIVRFTKELPGLNIKVALKDVTMDQSDEMKRRSVNCEKLVSRIMHFGICPLLACWENREQTLSALLYPYMEGRNLSMALEKDKEAVNNPQGTVKMDYKVRLRILFQVAAAIEYLHTPVNKYRGTVFHRDLKTDNIVLDGKMNARLIDFGLSRELRPGRDTQTMTQTDMYGTDGYYQTSALNSKSMNRTHDLYSFGVVIKQMLTGLTAIELKKKNSQFVKLKRIKAVWDNDKEIRPCFTKLLKLSEKCINSPNMHGKSEETLLCPKQDILDIINDITDCPRWENDNNRCQLCMVNELGPGAATLSGHTSSNCKSNGVRVCVACMRNFYLNPIKCHSCDGYIRPPVGDGWGALLIAGNDTAAPFAISFTEDILKLRQILVSKCPPVTCIEEDVVKAVVPSEPGKPCSMQTDVDEAFRTLSDSNLDKLILVFCGHYDANKGFRLGSNTEYMSAELLTEKLNSMKNTNLFVLFLDCCNPPDINIKNKNKQVLQLNACSSRDEVNDNIFTKFIQQALIRKSKKERCLNAKNGREDCDKCKDFPSDFITVYDLHRYVDNHYKEHEQLPKPEFKSMTPSSYDSAIIAFRYDFEFFVKLTVCKADKTREDIQVCPAEYKDITSLKTMILRDVINKDEQLWSGIDNDKHSNIVSIVYIYGPRTENVVEMDTMEKLMAAWNAKVGSLVAKLRDGQMLKEGPVAVCTSAFHPQALLTHGQILDYGIVEVKNDVVQIKVTDPSALLDELPDHLVSGILTDDAHQYSPFITFSRSQTSLSQASNNSREMSDIQITDPPRGELATDDVDVTALGAELRSGSGSMKEPEENQAQYAGNQSQPVAVDPGELVPGFVTFHLEEN